MKDMFQMRSSKRIPTQGWDNAGGLVNWRGNNELQKAGSGTMAEQCSMPVRFLSV